MTKFRLPLLTAVLALVAHPATALQMSPFTAEFTEAELVSGAIYNVFNDTDAPMAIEVSVRYRDMDTSGEDILTDAEDDFIAFPTQMILFPKEVQAVRIQWIGEKSADQEVPFRVIAEQIPINFAQEEQSEGVKLEFLTAIASSAYILPDEPIANLTTELVLVDLAGDENSFLRLSIVNTGNHHISMSDPVITLTSAVDNSSVTLTAEMLGDEIRQANIFGGHQRDYRIPWPADLPVGPATVSGFEYTQR